MKGEKRGKDYSIPPSHKFHSTSRLLSSQSPFSSTLKSLFPDFLLSKNHSSFFLPTSSDHYPHHRVLWSPFSPLFDPSANAEKTRQIETALFFLLSPSSNLAFPGSPSSISTPLSISIDSVSQSSLQTKITTLIDIVVVVLSFDQK